MVADTTIDTPWMTVEEACVYLRIDHLTRPRDHIDNARRAGKLQARIVSRRLLFKRSWLDEYIEHHCKTGRGEESEACES